MNYRALCLISLLSASLVYAAGQDNTQVAVHNNRQSPQGTFFSVSGSVRTLDNQPARDARIEVRSLGTGQQVASGYTLPNGSFEFGNIPRGVYEVVATAGVQEVRQRVDVYDPAVSVQLRLPVQAADVDKSGNSGTVSVTQLKIPDKARKLYAKAEEAMQKQKLQQAREQVEKALQAFPNYAQALTLRGILNLQDSKLEDACTDMEKAVKVDYGYGLGYIALGAVYNVMNRFEDAARVLERGIALKPSSWQGYFELSKALLGKGQFEAALRQVNKSSEMAPPDYPSLHLVRAHALLGLKNYNQAVTELEAFLVSEPNGADSAHVRATLDQVRSFMAKRK